MPVQSWGRAYLAAGAAPDPATTAWVNAVVTAGGTVGGAEQGYVDTLIKGLKSDGLFSILDRLWLLASENIQQATIDIINLQSWTQHGTVTFSANAGMTGDGSTGYLDTSFTSGTNYIQNSASGGIYCTNNRTTNLGSIDGMAGFPAANCFEIQLLSDGINAFFQVNDSNTVALQIGGGTTRGSWSVARTGASARAAYKNGGSKVSDTQASAGVPGNSIFIFAGNFGGSPIRFSNDTLASAFLGGGLNDTQAKNVSDRINAYMTSLGINVY